MRRYFFSFSNISIIFVPIFLFFLIVLLDRQIVELPLKLNGESGLLENFQLLLLILNIILSTLLVIKFPNKNRSILYVMIVGFVFLAGEEISWGQHFFYWQTPDVFIEINDQRETNIHNVNNIHKLLEKIIETLIIIFFLIAPFVKNKSFKVIKLLDQYLPIPNKKYILNAILALLSKELDDLVGYEYGLFRLSEVQELFIYYLFTSYLINTYIDVARRQRSGDPGSKGAPFGSAKSG